MSRGGERTRGWAPEGFWRSTDSQGPGVSVILMSAGVSCLHTLFHPPPLPVNTAATETSEKAQLRCMHEPRVASLVWSVESQQQTWKCRFLSVPVLLCHTWHNLERNQLKPVGAIANPWCCLLVNQIVFHTGGMLFKTKEKLNMCWSNWCWDKHSTLLLKGKFTVEITELGWWGW